MGEESWWVGEESLDDSDSPKVTVFKTVDIYDPYEKTWSNGPDMNVPRSCHDTAVINSSLYAVGGFTTKNFYD